MQHTQSMKFAPQGGERLSFSIVLTGAIVVIVAALCAIDMAAVHALLSFP